MLHAGMYPTPAGLPPAQMVPPISPQPPQGNPESVPQLLARGYTLPCSTAAQAFTHMVPPMNRFPVALEVLQNQKYRDVVSIRLYYDWHTCVLSFFTHVIVH